MINKQEYLDIMAHNKFIVDKEGYVVCDHCHANCGQCGIGSWQSKCQEYLDHLPPKSKGFLAFLKNLFK